MARHFPTLTRNGFVLPSNIKASYEGAGEGRRSTGWDAPDNGINSINTPALRNLRSRSRAAVRNDPYAFNVIDKRVSNLIGTGITPRPTTDDDALRKLLQELWGDWVDESDADDRTDFYGQQALVARTVETSGECFVRLRPRSLDEGLAVPLQLQILAPEFVPHDKYESTKTGNVIRAGIEFNPGGKRVAYWMYLSHPRDAASLNAGYNQLVRVPAAQVLHIFEPVEPGQLRGVPRLSPVLKRLRSLDNYDDAVLFRQEVANLFAGFIKRPTPESGPVPRDPVTGAPLSLDRDGFTPMVALEPGTMQELGPGEEVEFSKPPDAGNNYPDFMRQQLMAAAAGSGTPYEILTGDMRGINDRALRVVLNEFRRRLEQLQFGVYVHQLCRPVRAAWMDMAMHNALSRLGERCTGRIDALAASAASVAVCGAHKVVIAANAMLMIHNPWTYAAGDAEDFRKVADVLDQTMEAIIAAYKAKAPDIDEVELRRLVAAETWLTANEAVALGLADEVGDGVKVKACLGQGAVLQRYQHAPAELLAQLDEPPEDDPELDPIDPPLVPPVVDSARLALMITQRCTAAGISNLVEPLLNSTQLESEEIVLAGLARAKAVNDLCVAARLPEFSAEYVSAGLDAAAVRARLFDKIVTSGKGFEIDNSLPLADDPAPKVLAKQPDPTSIWAARQIAQSGTAHGAKGARP